MPRRSSFLYYFPCRKRSSAPVARLPNTYCIIGPEARKLLRNCIQYSLLLFVLVILILWIGMEFQERQVKKLPGTLYLYERPNVCGLTLPANNHTSSLMMIPTTTNATTGDNSIIITTYPSLENLSQSENNDSTIVAHCGDCGQCSNPLDIDIYDNTKNSLFGDTVDCATRALIWGRKTAHKCMEESVGFTSGCNDCWVENIMCDLRYCVFICMWHGLFSQVENGGDSQALNRCTICDEKRCGPQFVTCAGANRRRTGILSDIERDQDQEVCQSVSTGWWDDAFLQDTYRQQLEREQTAQKEAAVQTTADHSRKLNLRA